MFIEESTRNFSLKGDWRSGSAAALHAVGHWFKSSIAHFFQVVAYIMKGKRIKRWIQKPLRFHHQDIHDELEDIKRLLGYVSGQVQELRDRVGELTESTSMRVPEQDGSSGQ